MFPDPPLAHVGLTEREAQHQGIAVRVARLPMSTVLRLSITHNFCSDHRPQHASISTG
jgi:pyruvate/2-oxoglutarate dehydrogenase complex dihydrolipoamide dehydrogenase (E3) component